MPQLEFPDQIAHTPVYVMPYFSHDPDRENDTDAQFITLGWSQWDSDEPSAKVVRYSGKRWSRQSEELPLSRLVDLTMLTALALENGGKFTHVDKGTFESQSAPEEIAYGSKRDRVALVDHLKSDDTLKRRFQKLYKVLQSIEANGGFK
jgi:Family of unknown function (DUF6530)